MIARLCYMACGVLGVAAFILSFLFFGRALANVIDSRSREAAYIGRQGPIDLSPGTLVELLYTTTIHKGSIHIEAMIVRVKTNTGAYPRTSTSWPVDCPN
jgi:hypothetical protein